eukprot:TRINITY_DN9055_c0_g1_i1.p1 TRINITY_DN9055_c0_g1~~TRINITY_DN9055_c0_g1_i1.p1  ORF type:complete len:610 (+),score=122.36 TRINITY_DN9055_c0_g1_i1:2-1831(+)
MNNKELLILYGSQTGTAKDVAEDIGREGKKRNYTSKVVDILDFNVVDLPKLDLVIFVCSTCGQGEVPDNMKPFWRFLLRKNLPKSSLEGLYFAVFGLGDSAYAKYNYVSKMLHNRLVQLGGEPLVRRGDGNDQHPYGLYGDLFPWMDDMWRRIQTLFPLPIAAPKSDKLPPPRYKFIFHTPSNGSPLNSSPDLEPEAKRARIEHDHLDYSQTNPYLSRLISNQRITDKDWEQDVRHIVLDITNSGISYNPGDVVYVKPKNPSKAVTQLFNLLNFDENQIITDIVPNQPDVVSVPSFKFPITVHELFAEYIDILGTPKRYFFELLSYFATNKEQSDRLKFFSSKEGYEQLYDYNFKSKRNCIDIFYDFDSARPTSIEYLLDLITPLRARPFSISSCQTMYPNEIHISMVVVQYKSIINRIKHGICSTWLANIETDKSHIKIPIWVRKGTISLPTDPSTPLIMIGPGTGCAIFRSIIQFYHQKNTKGETVPTIAFFFGCRKEKSDFLYEREWKDYVESGTLKLMSAAFSRDQPKRLYVTHNIIEHQDLMWDLIENKKGVIMVSGKSGNMPRDVKKAFVQIISTKTNTSEDEAEKYMTTMERENRYLTETWS